MHATLSCVLLDVGGTLWPDRWPTTPGSTDLVVAQLRQALPQLDRAHAYQLERRLHACYAEHRRAMHAAHSQVQNTDAVIRAVATEFGLPTNDQMTRVLRVAMRVAPIGQVRLFAGATTLLRQIKAWNLRCIVVTNATWRDSVAYQQDFADLGIGSYIDAVVSSVDVGFHKPHRAMFETALQAAACPVAACVMIGNSEAKDIAPARALGMRTILVALDQPLPAGSTAHAVADSLAAVTAILGAWC